VSELPPIGDLTTLARTREAWHQVAEHVLARARYDATGRIGLSVVPGGYGTPPYDRGDVAEALHVVGNDLHITRGDASEAHPLTTVAEAARAAGIEPGAPANVYKPVTPLDPDAPLEVDVGAAHVLSTWFEVGWAALDELRAEASADAEPSTLTLWPEHFDAAVELGSEPLGTRGTFGVSPGDTDHAEPYLYVTHWADVPDDVYWNDTAFPGASLSYATVAAAPNAKGAALDFFRMGQTRISSAPG
jgi:hypothetical protein